LDQYSQILAQIAAIEARLNFSEDRINKLLRFVSEGNGKPSLLAEVAIIKEAMARLQVDYNREDLALKETIRDMKQALEDNCRAFREEKKEEPEEEESSTKSSTVTIVLAILTSLFTLLGLIVTTTPSIIDAIDKSEILNSDMTSSSSTDR
jgi:hypothetical protein